MDASAQVIFLLQVIINLAPIAVYFLVLGLVNSQARPMMVDARSDFLVLTLVFVPVMIWPVPLLMGSGLWWVLLLGLTAGAVGMRRLLPARDSGWVIYNITEPRCVRLFEQAVRSLGWQWVRDGDTVRFPEKQLTIRFTSLPVLRNVTLHVTGAGSSEPAGSRDRLELHLSKQALLPSVSGSCMVLLGVVLMMFPLWMMSRHMNAIVELVTRLLFA